MFINFKIQDLNQVRELKSENKLEKREEKKAKQNQKTIQGNGCVNLTNN
uniref:Uncharacterized protein n=1 Tax=Aegilops tauschii subsp. strangulata TaxID=200361 RepID=A0A453DV29_AEGTS